MVQVNQKVKTGLGTGTVQGMFEIRQGGDLIEDVVLVRLPVDAETSRHLADASCITPNATGSALFVFSLSELSDTGRN